MLKWEGGEGSSEFPQGDPLCSLRYWKGHWGAGRLAPKGASQSSTVLRVARVAWVAWVAWVSADADQVDSQCTVCDFFSWVSWQLRESTELKHNLFDKQIMIACKQLSLSDCSHFGANPFAADLGWDVEKRTHVQLLRCKQLAVDFSTARSEMFIWSPGIHRRLFNNQRTITINIESTQPHCWCPC